MSEENFLETKSISALENFQFKVSEYQRGYRWNKQQVYDLLNDLYEFYLTKQNNSERYCLQPVVVKPLKQENNSVVWEVIDGQQRLTTIYILYAYIAKSIGDPSEKLFTIEYLTRKESEKFLTEINASNFAEEFQNADFYFMANAYKNISAWFEEKEPSTIKRKNLVWNMHNTLLESTEIIWYQVNDGTPSVELFTKINIGKIELTNAELIKALILGKTYGGSIAKLDIASEWDRIENELQDDSFWYFLSNEDSYQNRIDYIFELIAQIKNDALAEKITDYDNKYFVFLVFDRYFKEQGNVVDDTWNLVRKYYSFMKYWYRNTELYHKVGYLIYFGKKMAEILKAVEFSKKSDTEKIFRLMIKGTLKKIPDKNSLQELNYGDSSVKNVLVLHNILTMKNGEQRFPFDKLKKERWNIEHIHAVESKIPQTYEDRERWLNVSSEWIKSPQLKKAVENFVANKFYRRDDEFQKLYKEILEEWGGSTDINDISNLALLDESTNKAYKNAIFPAKRKEIILRDKGGQFIPVCTRNIFLKYYSPESENFLLWTADDRKNYLRDIESKLGDYLL